MTTVSTRENTFLGVSPIKNMYNLRGSFFLCYSGAGATYYTDSTTKFKRAMSRQNNYIFRGSWRCGATATVGTANGTIEAPTSLRRSQRLHIDASPLEGLCDGSRKHCVANGQNGEELLQHRVHVARGTGVSEAHKTRAVHSNASQTPIVALIAVGGGASERIAGVALPIGGEVERVGCRLPFGNWAAGMGWVSRRKIEHLQFYIQDGLGHHLMNCVRRVRRL